MTGGTRQPKQPRSQATKEKILEAAHRLFGDRGYYKTTTNHIAQEAGVSIGSLYAYYQDREEILSDLVVKFDSSLNHALEDLAQEAEFCHTDIRLWVQRVIERMTSLRASSRDLYLPLRSLEHSSAKVAQTFQLQRKREVSIILEYLRHNAKILRIGDLEPAAFVVRGMIDAVVDEMVFGEGQDGSKILQATVDAICRYLFDSTQPS